MYKLGIIGKGISYSLSPLIHQNFAKQFDIEVDYQIYDIKDDPVAFVEEFFANNGYGLNITKPYKEAFSDKFPDTAKSINCLYENGNKAASTDGPGLTKDLDSKEIDYLDMNILVYGLGGASKSILNSIKNSKNVFIANRSEEKLKNVLMKEKKLKKYDGQSLDLIISCTQGLDLNTIKYFEHLNIKDDAVLYDINYSNQTNALFSELSLVKESNYYDGVGMLVEQAAACFYLWFGKSPEVEGMKKELNERI